MLDVSIYIFNEADEEWQRLDLYENEGIQIVDSIQNLREPDKAFMAFSKQFSVPASKQNNKIFKHFYNADISDGFDARVRVGATIKVNGFDYKTGRARLTGCKLKDGVAQSYSIIFYDAMSEIKERVAKASLSSLTDLQMYNHPYTSTKVKDGFEVGLYYNAGSMDRVTASQDRNIIYPFISHTKQYLYNSTATPPIYNIEDSTESLDYTQLKPAIRFIDIFGAIESFADITFDTSGLLAKDEFLGMYLWLHKDKGGIVGIDDNESWFNYADHTFASGTDVSYPTATPGSIAYDFFNIDFGSFWDFDFAFTITGAGLYDVEIYNAYYPGVIYKKEVGLSGNQTVSLRLFDGAVSRYFRPNVRVISAGTITSVDMQLTAEINYPSSTISGVYDHAAQTPNDELDVPFNMPEMTVMDFLGSVMKMFNATMERGDDGVYYIETINDYYTGGATTDITEYVDPTETTIEPSRPYDTLSFKWEEAGTFLMNNRYRLLEDWYGDDQYEVGDVFEDNDYEIKVGFEKILFERMTDLNDNSLSNNIWAWCADEDGNAYVGKPICFFFDANTYTSGSDIEWDHDASTSTSYVLCQNTTIGTTPELSLSFKQEIDEYEGFTLDDSLFSEFWEDYIAGVYSIDSRLVTVRAVLPPSFLLTYSLKDTIIYKNREYFINEINVDLTTGEAEIELITKWL